jgi:hypothetical protein
VREVTVSPREASYRPSGDATRSPGSYRIGEAAMRKPPKTPLGSRYPVHPSNDVKTVLILACAMMAMIVALTATPNDAATAVGFLH